MTRNTQKTQAFVKNVQNAGMLLNYTLTHFVSLSHSRNTHTQPDHGTNNKKHLFTRRLKLAGTKKIRVYPSPRHNRSAAREKVFLHIYTTTGVNIGLECVQLNE